MNTRSRVVAGLGMLAGVWMAAAAGMSRVQAGQAPPPTPPRAIAARAPVYILLQATMDDEINTPASTDRLPRALKVVGQLQSRAAAFHPVCLLQFNGVMANRLGAEDYTTHAAGAVKESAERGLVEIGYDGTEEPTFVARPRPNLRGADTSGKRWLARLQAHRWFLAEWKDTLSGEPDPSRSGGFKRVQEVFGRVDFVRGATFEPWYAAELVHALAALGSRPAVAGFPELASYPARNLDGYRGGTPMTSDALAADERCAPEVFWLDNALRISDYGALGERVFNAYEGPEALAKYLEGLDRSKLHVVQVRLGHPAVYMKPGFGARNYQTPLEHAYDNPKAPNLPQAALRSPEERAAAYAREDAALEWLVTTFFPANAGSRFVSVRQLAGQAEAGVAQPVTRAALTEAATSLVAKTDAAKGQLPLFVRAGARYFSLADLFGLLVTAMGEATAPGAWPASARLLPLFGPMEVGQPAPASGVRIPVATLIDQCKVLGDTMAAGEWTLVPRNIVPAQVTIGTVTVTAAQFLRAMAEAYIGQTGSADVEVRWTGGNSALGDALPATRPVSDRGGTWTARPAAIRFEN